MKQVAQNYAQALFAIAKEENNVEPYLEQAKLLLNLFNENDDLFTLLDSRFFDSEKRKQNVDILLKDFAFNIKNILKVMIDNHRIDDAQDIFQSFLSLCNEHLGIKEGYLYSSFLLKKDVVNKIEQTIAKKENNKISLIQRVDPSLIGGCKVVIAGHVYDYSVKNRLEKMQINLLNKGD